MFPCDKDSQAGISYVLTGEKKTKAGLIHIYCENKEFKKNFYLKQNQILYSVHIDFLY